MSSENKASPGAADFASRLLDREVDPAYRQEWTSVLMREKEKPHGEDFLSVVVFRIHGEWLALSTNAFKEICERRPIHSVPHRAGKVLLGLVNNRGRLRLCVALDRLLDIEESKEEGKAALSRMIVVENKADTWIFPCDEVVGIQHFPTRIVTNVPVTVAKSTANFLKGMLPREKLVGWIDEELLFSSLRRAVT